MSRVFQIVCVVVTVASLGASAWAVNIETVPVGNPGNTSDTHGNGYGSVSYEYNIGKYEVSNAEYCEFLNAVATEGDPHGLYNTEMGGGWNDIGGISRSGSGTGGDPWVYTPRANRANRPVNYVNFWDACRFANWLHNGQGAGDTENGAYTLTAGGIASNTVTRNADWKWAVTSEDEWYKAAYYDGGSGVYYDYPTGSNMTPKLEAPAGTDLTNGSANYYGSGYVDPTYYTTECGAYDAKPSDSPYGTFDQGGNVLEWNEAIIGSYRGIRASSFLGGGGFLCASLRDYGTPANEATNLGFRVAQRSTVPSGTSYVVNSLLDADTTPADGVVTLREAIEAANTNAIVGDAPAGSATDVDIITFHTSLTGGTITLSGTQIDITDDLTIQGPGADQLAINGDNKSRVLSVSGADTECSLSGLMITGGHAIDLGGGISNGSTLTLTNTMVSANLAYSVGEYSTGGGICNHGTLTLTNSMVSDNSSEHVGGGIHNSGGAVTLTNTTISGNSAGNDGGGIYNYNGDLTLTNTTVSGNSAFFGGGIYNYNGDLALTNTTVSGNSATEGGGIYNWDGILRLTNTTLLYNSAWMFGGGIRNNGDLTLTNTIVAGSFTDDVRGAVNPNSSHNLIGDAATSGGLTDDVNGNIVGVSDLSWLGPLADNGGPTLTHSIAAGAPAVDAGDNAAAIAAGLITDQRGYARFVGTVDIGAYEYSVEDNIAPSDPVFLKAKDPWDAIFQDNPAQTMDLVAHGSRHEITVLYDDPDHNLDKVYLRISGNGGEDDNPQTIRASVLSGGVERLDGEGAYVGLPLGFAANPTADGCEVTWTFVIDGEAWADGSVVDFYAWSTDIIGVESEHIQCDANAEFRGPARLETRYETNGAWVISMPVSGEGYGEEDDFWGDVADVFVGMGMDELLEGSVAAILGSAAGTVAKRVLMLKTYLEMASLIPAWIEQYDPVTILPIGPDGTLNEDGEAREFISALGPDDDEFSAFVYMDFQRAWYTTGGPTYSEYAIEHHHDRLDDLRWINDDLRLNAQSSLLDGIEALDRSQVLLSRQEYATLDPRLCYLVIPKESIHVGHLPNWDDPFRWGPRKVRWKADGLNWSIFGGYAHGDSATAMVIPDGWSPNLQGAIRLNYGDKDGPRIQDESTSTDTVNGTDFGEVRTGSEGVTHTFTITNNHPTETLTLRENPIWISDQFNPAFFIDSQPTDLSLDPDDHITFDIRFKPEVTDSYLANIGVISTAKYLPVWFRVEGEGAPTNSSHAQGTVSVVTGSLSGYVVDGGVGLADVYLYLDANENGVHDEGERTSTTNADGIYSFGDLSSGMYMVALLGQDGLTPGVIDTVTATVDVGGTEAERHVTVSQDITATASAYLAVADEQGEPLTELAFGPVLLGETQTRSFILRNDGLAELVIADPPVMPAVYLIDSGAGGNWQTLQSGEQATVDVTLTPIAGGDASGTLTMESSTPNAPLVEITLSGQGGASVEGRHIFYNDSAFDEGGASANFFDDAAIDPTKSALLSDETATSANYTSYSRGLNGVMLDIAGLADAVSLSSSDFLFKAGNTTELSGWADAPAPTSVTIRPGEGVGESDRATIIWADNSIQNQWLKVTVLATANTGLPADDVFYFGNAVGDCDGDGQVGGGDCAMLTGQFGLRGGIGTLAADFNADGQVDLGDFAIMRSASGNSVSIPTFPPASPGAPLSAPAAGGEAGLDGLAVTGRVTSVNPEIAIVTAPSTDLLTPPLTDYISDAIPISGGASWARPYRQATGQYDLRPLSDGPENDGLIDGLIVDLLETADFSNL